MVVPIFVGDFCVGSFEDFKHEAAVFENVPVAVLVEFSARGRHGSGPDGAGFLADGFGVVAHTDGEVNIFDGDEIRVEAAEVIKSFTGSPEGTEGDFVFGQVGEEDCSASNDAEGPAFGKNHVSASDIATLSEFFDDDAQELGMHLAVGVDGDDNIARACSGAGIANTGEVLGVFFCDDGSKFPRDLFGPVGTAVEHDDGFDLVRANFRSCGNGIQSGGEIFLLVVGRDDDGDFHSWLSIALSEVIPVFMIRQIVVHPGGAHKDDFLACALLMAETGVPVYRREPSEDDLSDVATAVVDVGLEWDESKMNFDHHQFPRDAEPLCALSLVLKHLGLYEETHKFCDWLIVAEWMDTRGPNDTAKWLGVERDAMAKLNSPIDITLLRRFAASAEHLPGQPIYEVMKMVGEDLISFVRGMKKQLEYLGENAEVWEMSFGKKVLFLPRTDPMPSDPSMGMGRYVEDQGLEEEVVAMVYPDRRGEGYGLGRFNDDKRMEYTQIKDEPDVHFAHNKGFIAKVSATEVPRLKVLIEKSWA